MLSEIDSLPIVPQNKQHLYQTYVLSRVSWGLTVTNSSKAWAIQYLDNLVSHYFCEWLDIPICTTLSGIILSKNQFGLSLRLPSMKFLQCQTVQQNISKSPPNNNI